MPTNAGSISIAVFKTACHLRSIKNPYEQYAQRAEGLLRAVRNGHLSTEQAEQHLAALEADALSLKVAIERDSISGFLKRVFTRKSPLAHYTLDGGVPAPHPNMTDDDLRDFETSFNIPSSFPARQ